MITCIINGKAAYPAASQSLKITYSNQYISEDGEYSYDISFPMAIMENRRMFHNVSRFDVSKTVKSYDDCKLYVGGRLILSGVGTIIGVSDSEIKLQIVGGKSRVKYNERFNKEYIDEMDLGKAKHGTDFDADQFQELEPLEIAMLLHACPITDMYGFFGFPFATVMGKYVYTPVYDETNDIIANFMFGKNNYNYIYNTAVHPNLNYILAMVINKMGYVVERNDFAVEPWNRLYIASAYKSDEFRHALPHWTAYTFLEEYRKLFNAKIYFNEQKKTVYIIGTSELLGADTVEIEPLDEFSVDYDEDGSLNTIDTSNVEYNLGDSEERTEYETIPQKVLTGFDVYELNGMAPNLDTEISQWDMKKKRTTIIKRLYADGTLQAYYVWKADEEDDSKGSWFECGEFSPLIRNKESDDSIELKIAPAAVTVRNVDFTNVTNWFASIAGTSTDQRPRYLLSVTNEKEAEAKEKTTDEDGYSYCTVEDAIDDESNMDDDEDDDDVMLIYFLGEKYHNPTTPVQSGLPSLLPESCICDSNTHGNWMAWPNPITDDRHLKRVFGITKGWSLSLVQRATYGLSDFHGKKVVDNKNCMEVKFRSSSIPDPSKIYIIHNKKFVCEKIEMEVKDDQIEPVYTGYFYMMA